MSFEQYLNKNKKNSALGRIFFVLWRKLRKGSGEKWGVVVSYC